MKLPVACMHEYLHSHYFAGESFGFRVYGAGFGSSPFDTSSWLVNGVLWCRV